MASAKSQDIFGSAKQGVNSHMKSQRVGRDLGSGKAQPQEGGKEEINNLDAEIVIESGEDTYYRSGDRINGSILLDVGREGLECKGVTTSVTGEASTHFWEKQTIDKGTEGKSRDWHYDEEQYFKLKRLVLGDGNTVQVLPEGTHEFKFNEVLPDNLPSTFTGKYGQVRYYVGIRVLRISDDDPEMTAKKDFTVMSLAEDLANITEANQGCTVNVTRHFGILCCMSGPLSAEVTTNKTGFVPGEAILVQVTVDNQSNRVVKEASIHLKQRVTFYGLKHGRGMQHSEKDINVIAYVNLPDEVKPGENKSWKNQEISIPSDLPPSDLMNCTIIDISYSLLFNLVPRGITQLIQCELPFIIGTTSSRESYYNT